MTIYKRFPLSKARFMKWLESLPANEPVQPNRTDTQCDCPLEVALSILVEPAHWSICSAGFKRYHKDDSWTSCPQWARSFIDRVDGFRPRATWSIITAAQCITLLKKSR